VTSTTLSSDSGETERLPDKWPAIIVDLDGTLALFQGRTWSEYEKCLDDKLMEGVAKLVHAMAKFGHAIIVLTGRPTQYRDLTIKWLVCNNIHFDALLMRTPRDRSSNQAYKEAAYRKWIEPKYDVLFAIDDNPHVVRMFRSIGVTVLDVGSSY
jgi:hypothetical protein